MQVSVLVGRRVAVDGVGVWEAPVVAALALAAQGQVVEEVARGDEEGGGHADAEQDAVRDADSTGRRRGGGGLRVGPEQVWGMVDK